jgi:hypothetical protein
MAVMQVPQQPPNIEAAGRVTDQDDIIADRNLTARDTLRQVALQSCCARGHGRSGEIVEVMEHLISGLPCLEQRRNATVVFKLTERVKAGEAWYKHDVKTFSGWGSRVLIGHGLS